MRSSILSQSEHSHREPLQQSHQCSLPYWRHKRLVQNDVLESDKAVCAYRIFSTSFWREVWLTHWKITKEQSGSKAEQSHRLAFWGSHDGFNEEEPYKEQCKEGEKQVDKMPGLNLVHAFYWSTFPGLIITCTTVYRCGLDLFNATGYFKMLKEWLLRIPN